MEIDNNWKALHINQMINGRMVIFTPFVEYKFEEKNRFRIYDEIDLTKRVVPMILTDTHIYKYGYDEERTRKCWRRLKRPEFEKLMNTAEARYYKKAVNCLKHRRSIAPQPHTQAGKHVMNNGPKYECYLDDETAELMFTIDTYQD